MKLLLALLLLNSALYSQEGSKPKKEHNPEVIYIRKFAGIEFEKLGKEGEYVRGIYKNTIYTYKVGFNDGFPYLISVNTENILSEEDLRRRREE